MPFHRFELGVEETGTVAWVEKEGRGSESRDGWGGEGRGFNSRRMTVMGEEVEDMSE